jgi:serine/threonine-protein kinase
LQLEDNTEPWAGLGHALAVSGKREEALKVLEHLDELAKHRCVAPYNFALVHIGLGQNDQAFEWLERACQARSYLLAIYLNTDARLRPIYSDTRYQDLLHRIRLLRRAR